MTLINTVLYNLIKYTGPARPADKTGTASGPYENRGHRNFVISVKFSIRLLKAREKRKPNKVIENSVLQIQYSAL